MRPLALAVVLASSVFASLAVSGCATYSDDLVRAQRAYESSEDERALAIFRVLEVDTSRLSDSDRAHYAYLRGMTDFRMGYKSESRHWLGLAASMEQALPGSLPPDWAKHLTDTLKELNEEVFTAGVESLTNSATAKKAPDDDSSGTDSVRNPALKPSDSP